MRSLPQRGYIALSSDGETLVSIGEIAGLSKVNDITTATIRLSALETGREIQVLPGHVSPVSAVGLARTAG